jgi:hypothetical protein
LYWWFELWDIQTLLIMIFWRYNLNLKCSKEAHLLKAWLPACALLGSWGRFRVGSRGIKLCHWECVLEGCSSPSFPATTCTRQEFWSTRHSLAMTFCLIIGPKAIEPDDHRLKPLKPWVKTNLSYLKVDFLSYLL